MIKNVFDFLCSVFFAFISIRYAMLVFIVASLSIAASFAAQKHQKCYL